MVAVPHTIQIIEFLITPPNLLYFFLFWFPFYLFLLGSVWVFTQFYTQTNGRSVFKLSSSKLIVFYYYILSLVILLSVYLVTEESGLWASHFTFTYSSYSIFYPLILFLIFFWWLLFYRTHPSRIFYEYSWFFLPFSFWIFYLYQAATPFSIVFCLEIVSLFVLVLAGNSSLFFFDRCEINIYTKSPPLRMRLFKTFFLLFFWISALLSLGFVFVLIILTFSTNDLSFVTLIITSSSVVWIHSLPSLLCFFTLFILLCFLKLGVPPFIIWKILALENQPWVFFTTYLFYYTPLLLFYISNLFIFFSSLGLVLWSDILSFFLLVGVISLFYFLYNVWTVKLFLIVSSAFTAILFLISSTHISSVNTFFFLPNFIKLYVIVYISSLVPFFFIFIEVTGFFTTLKDVSSRTAKWLIFFLCSLIGIPPFFTFFIKLGLFSVIFSYSNFFDLIIIFFFFFTSIFFYFSFYKYFAYTLFIVPSKKLFANPFSHRVKGSLSFKSSGFVYIYPLLAILVLIIFGGQVFFFDWVILILFNF